MSVRTVKVNIPLFLASVIIGICVASMLLAIPADHPLIVLRKSLGTTASLIATWILLYSLLVLCLWHARRIAALKKTRDFYASIIVLLAFAGLTLLYLVAGRTFFEMVYEYTAVYIGMAAIYSWIYFTWGTFQRVKIFNIETTALFITWLFTVIRLQTSLIALWPPFDSIGYWFETSLAQGAIWAMYIASGASVAIMIVRALLGRERAPFELGA